MGTFEEMMDAVAAKQQRLADAKPAAPAFVEDPELERLGSRMEDLRVSSPREYASPQLADVRNRLLVYRNRKAAASAMTGSDS